MATTEWAIRSEEVYDIETPQIEETPKERAERIRAERVSDLIANHIEVEYHPTCIPGQNYLAMVTCYDGDSGFHEFGATEKEARENLIDWLWEVVK